MDQTNRALIVSAALLWIFVALLVIMLAWGKPDESINRLGDLAGYLDHHNTAATQLVITFGGLIFALFGVVIIIFELAPPQTGTVRVAKVGAGEARIGTDEIMLRLEEELRSIPQLAGVQAKVIGRGHKAEVNLDLYVSAEADLAATSQEACRRAREIVEERMGVELDCQPHAEVHYRELVVGQQAAPFTTAKAPPSGSPFAAEPSHEATEATQEDRPAVT